MMKFLVILVIVCAVQANERDDHRRQERPTIPLQKCYNLVCPKGTVSCRKTTGTTPSNDKVVMKLQCEDINGDVLNAGLFYRLNPNKGVTFHTYEVQHDITEPL